ncbi:MAG: tetratricopeptide repeat protein [Pirellulales bacterium]|nr:tetratricopeptide repeat protein [Pirellulales bacterium]
MTRFGRRFAIVPAVLLLAGGAAVLVDWWTCVGPGTMPHYVGRQACLDCHAKEDALWVGSDHDRAMAAATDGTVLGDFNDQRFEHFGVRSRMFRRGEKFLVETDDRDGKLREFEVKYTFGVRPLQQYLVEMADSRVQCLPLAWDTERRRWFHLYPDEPVPHHDFLHWTGPMQNWNYMCAHCHSTNFEKKFELATNAYHSTFSEINVSCEACHGPGSLHVELAEAKSLFWDRRVGYGLPNLKSVDSNVEIDSCAQCHAHQRAIYPGFKPGEPYLDYFVPSLLDGNLYYADGQILEEDYVFGSFLQSRMYREKVRCTDCHDPHSCTVKFKDEDKRRDKKSEANRIKNNQLCCQCHLAATYDTPQHHHHDPEKSLAGTLCIECHMAERTYMVVDPRRDHSLRNPRPDLTVALGIPNACNSPACHDAAKGETPQWALEYVEKWYGPKKEPEPKHFAYAIDAGRRFSPEGETLLVEAARRKDLSGMVRASVLLLLGRYLTGADGDAWAMIRGGLEDPDALVRLASARALDDLASARSRGAISEDEADRVLLDERFLRLLGDSRRAVRFEAVRVLSVVPRARLGRKHQKAFDAALAEYVEGHKAVDDEPMSYTAIGNVFLNQGDADAAEREYRKALAIDADFVPARSQLAMVYYGRGEKAKAEAEYGRILKSQEGRISRFATVVPEVYYSLGILVAEDEARWTEAAELLAKAAELAPTNPRIRRNLGWLYERMGRVEDAERELREAHRLSPSWVEALHTLGFFYLRHGQPAKAVQCARRWRELYPKDPAARQFLREAERAAGGEGE